MRKFLRRSLAISLFSVVSIQSGLAQREDENLLAFPESTEGLPGVGLLCDLPNFDGLWLSRRSAWAEVVAQEQESVVFLGDSITAQWQPDFQGYFPGMKKANRGINADTTRGMLNRVQDVIDVSPSAVVLLMGTNDIGFGGRPEDAAANIAEIAATLKAAHPELPIILCLTFPSSEKKRRPSEKIQVLNQYCLAAFKGDSQVTILDTWSLFANAEGDADTRYFKDHVHLNEEGYRMWAAALTPIFATLGLTETEPDHFEIEEGFVSLFNGEDLTGWGYRVTPRRKKPAKPNPKRPVFAVVDEAIDFDGRTVSSDGRYRAINGRLVVTTPPEGRRIQQLWTTEEFPSDFILKLEFRATPGADSGLFIRKPQLQCRDYWIAGPYEELENYQPQDWNELVITVKGEVAHATCNGEVIEEALPVPATGPIGLEGDRGQMEYRRIRLKTL